MMPNIIINLLLFLSIVCLLIIIIFLIKFRLRLFHDKKRFVILILSILIIFYYFIVNTNAFYMNRLKKLESKTESILVTFNTEFKRIPENITDLENFEYYNNSIKWLFFPFSKPRFNFVVVKDSTNNKISYSYYSFGFDNDDDSMYKLYTTDLKLAFNPFLKLMDGDILIKQGNLNFTQNSFYKSE